MKTIISLFIIALFVVGGGWLIWRDVNNSVSQLGVVATSTGAGPVGSTTVAQQTLTEGVIEKPLTPNKALETRALAIVARPITVNAVVPEKILADMKQQITDITASIKKNYDNLEPWLRLGALRKGLDDFKGAAEAWEFAGVLRPSNAVSFQNLWYLHANFLVDYPKSEREYIQALKNDPTMVDAYLNLVDLYLYHLTEFKSAIPDLLKSGIAANTEINKKMALTSRLAMYYKDAGDIANAIKYFEQVAQFLPNDAGVQEELAKLRGQ